MSILQKIWITNMCVFVVQLAGFLYLMRFMEWDFAAVTILILWATISGFSRVVATFLPKEERSFWFGVASLNVIHVLLLLGAYIIVFIYLVKILPSLETLPELAFFIAGCVYLLLCAGSTILSTPEEERESFGLSAVEYAIAFLPSIAGVIFGGILLLRRRFQTV